MSEKPIRLKKASGQDVKTVSKQRENIKFEEVKSVGIFKKKDDDEEIQEVQIKKTELIFKEEDSFKAPICHGMMVLVTSYYSGNSFYVFQCRECGKVVCGVLEEKELK